MQALSSLAFPLYVCHRFIIQLKSTFLKMKPYPHVFLDITKAAQQF